VLHFPNRQCLGGDFGVGQFLKPPALWSGRERIGVNGSEGAPYVQGVLENNATEAPKGGLQVAAMRCSDFCHQAAWLQP
jgi:hypothetical protein